MYTCLCVCVCWVSISVTSSSDVLEHQINIRESILIWSAYGVGILQSKEVKSEGQ